MLIKIQVINSNIIIHDFKIKSQETIQSIKERLKNNPLLNIKNSKELLLYSGNNFLQDETQNANKSIHNNILYIMRNHNNNMMVNTDYNNMMVNIDSLENIIKKRAVSFAQGIKNKDQKFLFTREDPLFV
ncbi:hypothetical protein LCGC14_2781920 [marine sediment metagenome]|uniref:Ubiquitin-like domain-containing protein n=1 Tax=marine sediment metagenome TaxID=412755 RepID=A0A0F9B1N6_9ZZZZ